MPEITKQPQKKTPNSRIWLILLLAIVLIVVGIVGFGWLKRKSLAENYLANWCAEQGLECQADIVALGFNDVQLENVSVSGGGAVPFQSEGLAIALDWPSWLSPEVKRVSVRKPVLRAAIIEGELRLYGLENLVPEAASQDSETNARGAIPELDIQDGTIELLTDAGAVSGLFDFTGIPLETGAINLHVQPSRLIRGTAEVMWSKGDIVLNFRDGAILGDLDFVIETARLDSLALTDAAFKVKLGELDDLIAFDVSARAKEVYADGIKAENISMAGEGGFGRLDEFSLNTLFQELTEVSLVAQGERVSSEYGRLGRGEINVQIKQTASGLSGPVGISLSDAIVPQGQVGAATASGDLAVVLGPDSDPEIKYNGTLVLREAQLAVAERRELLANVALPEPLEQHGKTLKAEFSKALADFQIGLNIDAAYHSAGWVVRLNRPTLLKAEAGLILSIDPFPNQPWMKANQSGLEISGDVSLEGGRLMPKLTGILDAFVLEDGEASVHVNGLNLAPWAVAGRTISGHFDTLEVVTGEQTRVLANGEVTLAGAMPGVDLKPTRLIGNVSAVQAIEGWRVQTQNNTCVGFTSEGIGAGTLKFAAMTVPLCPVDGRFVRQENGRSIGRIDLGDLSLPFVTGDSNGTFGVDDAALEWVAGDAFSMTVKGTKFHLPLQFSVDDLLIDGDTPEVVFTFADGPATLKARLGETRFGGSMVPANVTSRDFVFDGMTTQAGIDGDMRAGHVRIADLNPEAVYQPVVAELSARMTDGIVKLQGPIRNEARNLVIANADMSLHLGTFTGDAQILMVPLQFDLGELQPVHLSELLRDVLINARGGLSGGADFDIDSGALSGTGYVDFSDIIFDTLNVGTVTGVNGRINFTDMLALTSAPSQRLTIDHMDPGVPMQDGEILFQIVEGTTTKLEGAKWPFADGSLEIMPTVIIADEDFETITMQAKELELEQLIQVFEIPDLMATGTVSGTFPVDIEGANIMLRQAELIADETGGWLSYRGEALETAKGQHEYADHAFEALKALDFRVMRLVADGNMIGRILLSVDLLGSNEDVLGGAEFDFGLTLDSNLWQLLNTFSDRQRETYVDEYLELKRLQDAQTGNE